MICAECDDKLETLNQFRIQAIVAQHEFEDILKSLTYHEQDYPYSNMNMMNQMQTMRGIDDEIYDNHHIYTEQPAASLEDKYSTDGYSSHDQCHYIGELHLALDDEDDNQAETQSLVSNPYAENIQPEISMTPQLAPIIEEVLPETDPVLSEVTKEEDFHYDDFDDTCQSFTSTSPIDRNNVDNAIDQKIEEMILNKGKKRNPKICPVCNKLFRTNWKLKEHMEVHAENQTKFICSFEGCQKAFKSKIGVEEHQAKHTGKFDTFPMVSGFLMLCLILGEFKFSCGICSKPFFNRSYLISHQRQHTNQKIFPCSLCPKTFKTKQNLLDHENRHRGIKSFVCHCSKSFTTKTHLESHQKTHQADELKEKFVCGECNKSFGTKSYLKTHMKWHQVELKNFKCYCGKNFTQLSDLKSHYLVHTQEKPHQCEKCGRSFARVDGLVGHTKRVHSDNRHVCNDCGKGYTKLSSLTNHKQRCMFL